MNEHHLRVGRTARYYSLGASGPAVREIWIVCHGYAQLAGRFLRHFRPLEHPARLIVAPEALSRFYLDTTLPHGPDARVGATWMTREDRDSEIADYVEYLETLARTLTAANAESRPRLVAFGFSQGVSTVLRWLAFGHTTVDRVIAWSGSLPQDVDLAATRGRFGAQPVDYAFGRADPLFDEARVEQQTAMLAAAGVPFVLSRFEGGHRIPADALIRVAGAPPE